MSKNCSLASYHVDYFWPPFIELAKNFGLFHKKINKNLKELLANPIQYLPCSPQQNSWYKRLNQFSSVEFSSVAQLCPGANRPRLGLCLEARVPLQGRPGSRGCIPDAPGETGIHLEWKQRTPLCSRVTAGPIDLI